jgi:signal recognition particle receptor subunit beta
MALVNHAKREINAKIVYYGREGAGKRLSLQYIYDRIKPSLRGELKTVPANGDSLLFFDFSPFEHPVFGGYRIRFHMYSLCGAVTNPAAWKMTLKGADGVVIVVDASPDMVPANRESISRLRGFLAAYGVGLHDIPCVLQINRFASSGRSPGDGIAAELDVPDMRTCLSEAGSGKGVLDALSLISRDIMARIGQDDTLQAGERTITSEGVMDASAVEAAVLMPHESGERLVKPEFFQPRPEKSFLSAEGREKGEDAGERLQVVLTGQGASYSDGTVRIPLEIAFGGVSRRLVVSIAIEQE